MNNNVNEGDKKIMNNNPTVKNVNMINDIIGDSGNTRSYKIIVIILTVLMSLIGILMLIGGRITAGIIFFVIAFILLFTTIGIKFKSKKYKVDNKIVEEIEPLFKD